MTRIVWEHVPVTDLPEHLRNGIASNINVRLTIESEDNIALSAKQPFSLETLYAMSRPSFDSLADIADHVRSLRDEWD